MDENINKHLHDILDAINEIESFFGDKPKYFNEFCNDLCLRRAVERDIVEIDISTRPDCVSGEYLEVLDRLRAKRGTGICLELGLQTVNYHTLKRMNRGHSLAEFIDAVLQAKAYGFQVCAHVILNYPGDGMEDAVETARILSALRVDMVKIHSLYIAKNRAGIFVSC